MSTTRVQTPNCSQLSKAAPSSQLWHPQIMYITRLKGVEKEGEGEENGHAPDYLDALQKPFMQRQRFDSD